MHDSYLIDQLDINREWFRNLYATTSGEIHLSDRHLWQTIKADQGTERMANIRIGGPDAFVTDDVYLDAVNSFGNVTDTLFQLIRRWADEREGWTPEPRQDETNDGGAL